ncbi:MAG TPA: hypothetical protein VMA97_07310 [Streptosporangiaceae bacterium]|nr:hypothetical protein [Streptosporangiaceae bacterium]
MWVVGALDSARKPREFYAAASRVIRLHWLLTILLAAGLALRILTQLAYRPALLYIDSARYVRGESGQDPMGYRLVLWPLQRMGGLATVAAFQHLLGLGLACLLYTLLLRRGIWRWAAALAAAPILLDAYQLQAEQTIMPDVTFEALVLAGLAAMLWRREPAAWQLALGGGLFGLAVDFRQVGEVLILPALAFVAVRAVGWGPRLIQGALVAATFAVPVLAYMTIQFAVHGQFGVTQRGSYIFYGRVAAAADCATLRLPADERALCPSRQVVDALGIDGLVGDPKGPLLSYRPPRGLTIQAMAGRFDRAVLTQQPAAVLSAVDRDLVKLFALTRDQDPGDTPITRWQFQTTYPTYPPLITLHYVAAVRPGGGPPQVSRPLAVVLRDYQLHGGYTPGPVFALAAIAGLLGICALDREHRIMASACVLATVTAGAVLIVSDAYEFSWRYQLPALVLLPLAGVLGGAAITAKVRFEVAAWSGLRTEPWKGRWKRRRAYRDASRRVTSVTVPEIELKQPNLP